VSFLLLGNFEIRIQSIHISFKHRIMIRFTILLSGYFAALAVFSSVLSDRLDLVDSFSSSYVSVRQSGARPLLQLPAQRRTVRLHSAATEEVELKVDANGIYDLESKEDHL
jgi:hypothetical protein